MPRFKMTPLRTNNILQLYQWRDQINLDPPYQRLSIWGPEKQQCFIDSVLNGFDVPKLYFHELSPTSDKTNQYKYAVIDGKQRLVALFEFMSNKLPLADDFKFFDDETILATRAMYDDLMANFPRLRARFDSFDVPVTIVQTDDANFIDDLFARLNIQVPLSAPERRNALGGPLPFLIRKIGLHGFFTQCVRIRNDRFQHFDLAAKFLFLTRTNAIESTKKSMLDEFVTEFRKFRDAGRPEASPQSLQALESATVSILDEMKDFFTSNDSLLVSQGRATLLFHVFRIYHGTNISMPFTRQMLEQFNEELTAARKKSQRMASGSGESLSTLEQTLLAFDTEKQSPNDAGALTRQYNHLRSYLSLACNIDLLELG